MKRYLESRLPRRHADPDRRRHRRHGHGGETGAARHIEALNPSNPCLVTPGPPTPHVRPTAPARPRFARRSPLRLRGLPGQPLERGGVCPHRGLARLAGPGPVLTGPPGSGKSHLAAIFAERSGALTVPVAAVTAAAVPDLAQADALVIEDADRAEGPRRGRPVPPPQPRPRAGLERGGDRVASRRRLGAPVADLRSRLRLAPGIGVAPPDEALLKVVLVKLFLDRQLVVDTSVVDALALRPRPVAGAGPRRGGAPRPRGA